MKKVSICIAILAILVVYVRSEVPTPGSPAYLNDNALLNYALTLERLESAFYNQSLGSLSKAQFNSYGIDNMTYELLLTIRDHEAFHVSFLENILSTRVGVQTLPNCNYVFNYTSVAAFLYTAQLLENTGVKAYDGAINASTWEVITEYAAAIATVEARHASFLNGLLNQTGFPDAFDPVLSPAQIFAAASPFFANCSYPLTNVTLPQSSDNFRNANYTQQIVYTPNNTAFLNDNLVLQFALTLEHLEDTFYRQALVAINSSTWIAAGFSNQTYRYIQMIGDHEAAHVAALVATLSSRQATPVTECTYNFVFPNVTSFLATAEALESTGVTAYLGAATAISSTSLLQTAATIATVEARHTAFIRHLISLKPFPMNIDSSNNVSTVLGIAGPLINQCNYNLTQFLNIVGADNFRQNQTTTSTGMSTSGATSGATSGSTATSNSGSTATSNSGSTATSNSGSTATSNSGSTAAATTTSGSTAAATTTSGSATSTSGQVSSTGDGCTLMASVALILVAAIF